MSVEGSKVLPCPAPGEVLGGKYKIVRVIGEGGMGRVYEAQHQRLAQTVAVKVLREQERQVPELVARFEREARTAAKLSCPNAARVTDVDLLPDGTPYMVMEYLEGQDLDSEIAARGRLPVEEAVGYLLQACSAVAEAHALGIVHRDLKPHNLFLTGEAPNRTVKLLDFGISKMPTDTDASSVTLTRSSLGTPLYMSPEQIRSAKRADRRSDIWSLGVILYEVLTGTTPFEGESPTAVIAAITADTARPPHELRPGVPRELSEAVMRALAKDPEVRYQNVVDFAEAIQPFGPQGAWMPSRLTTSSPSNPRISISGISDAPTMRAPPARLELVQTADSTPDVPIPQANVSSDGEALEAKTLDDGKRGGKSVLLYASLIVVSIVAIVAFVLFERRHSADMPTAATAPTSAPPAVSVAPLETPRVTPVIESPAPPVTDPPTPATGKSPIVNTKPPTHPGNTGSKAGAKPTAEKTEPATKPPAPPPAENPLHL